MEQRPLAEVNIRWRLVGGGVLAGLVLGAGVMGLALLLPAEADLGPRQGLLTGLMLAPLLAVAGGGLLAYRRAEKLKLLHGGLVVSISFALILIFLCGLVFFGGWLIGAVG